MATKERQTKIRRFGNSLGVVLGLEVVKELSLEEGDDLSINVEQGKLVLSPYDEDFAAVVEANKESHRKFRNAYKELANR
jgi:putative addiction module antidote